MLLSAAALTAVLHTLIPDHWLPFVLVGRSRAWPSTKVVAISGLSALLHVLLSVLLGLLTLAAGLSAAEVVGETLERAGAILLALFGVVYAMWAWHKGGHFHPGGDRIHHALGNPGRESPEQEGDDRKPLHYPADTQLIQGRSDPSGLWLALIVGMNPCVLILPLMLAAAAQGLYALGLVIVAYSLPSMMLMVGLSVFGARGAQRLQLPGLARHMELVSGIVIALLGVAYWFMQA